MLKIKQLDYNWRQVGPYQSDECYEVDSLIVGQDGVTEIINMTPQDAGYTGNEFYDVKFSNGDVTTIYNPNVAIHKEEK